VISGVVIGIGFFAILIFFAVRQMTSEERRVGNEERGAKSDPLAEAEFVQGPTTAPPTEKERPPDSALPTSLVANEQCLDSPVELGSNSGADQGTESVTLAKADGPHELSELVLALWDKGRYIKGRLLGSGGSGLVRQYLDKETNTFMAVKSYRRAEGFNAGEFMKEAVILATISHPCVLGVVGMSLPRGSSGPRIALELMAHGSVADILKQVAVGETPEFWTHTNVAKIIVGMILGLIHIHSKGIFHRDLKPGNLLIGSDGLVRIGDFGSARLIDCGQTTTTNGVQTLIYAAPEILSKLPQSPKIDVYSFGLVLYEILFHRKVFPPDMAMVELTVRITSPGRRPGVPELTEPEHCRVNPVIRSIIERCWSVNPEDRPSFEEILAELESSGFPFYPDVDKNAVSAYIEEVRTRAPVG
jgi:serine/threonine protein kinase